MLLYFIISFCFALAVVLDLCFGQSGLLTPLTAMTGFYFTVTERWDKTVIPFVVACTLLDLSFGRLVPLSMLLVPIVLLAGSYWREHGNTKSLVTQVLPGCVIGVFVFMATSAYSACYSLNSGRSFDFLPFRFLMHGFVTGGCMMPLLVVLLNATMKAFGFRVYSASNSYKERGDADE